MEENQKKSKKGVFIFIALFVVLLPTTFFLGWKMNDIIVHTSTNKNNANEGTKKETKKIDDVIKDDDLESKVEDITNVDVNSLTVESNKVINSEAQGWDYSELPGSYDNMGLKVSVNKENNTGVIEIHWIKFHAYSTRYREKNAQGGTFGDNVQIITVNGFKGKVHSAYISGFGQSFGMETAFFVMTDGTVEYVPIQKLYDVCGYLDNSTVNSYGNVPNVSGVAKIVHADANAPKSTGAATTLGIKADGSFYDFHFNLDVNSLEA